METRPRVLQDLIHQYIHNEMEYPDSVPSHDIRKYTSANMIKIWNFLLSHVVSSKKARLIKKNLLLQGKWKQTQIQDSRHVILKHQIQNLKQQILQQTKNATILQFETQQLLQEQQEKEEEICLARKQIHSLQQSNLLYNTFISNSKLFSTILKEYSIILSESTKHSVTQNTSSTTFLKENLQTIIQHLLQDLKTNELQFLQQGHFGSKNSLPQLLHQMIQQFPSILPQELIHQLSLFTKESVSQMETEKLISFEQFTTQQYQQEQQFTITDINSLLQSKQSQHVNLFLQTQSNETQTKTLQKELDSILRSQFQYITEQDLKGNKLQEFMTLQLQLHSTKQTLLFLQQQETQYAQRSKVAKEKQQQMILKMKKLETVQIRSEQKRQWIQQLVVANMKLKKGFTTKQMQMTNLVQEKILQSLLPTILKLLFQTQHTIRLEVQQFETLVLQKQKKYSVIERREEWIEKVYQICRVSPTKSIQELIEYIWNQIVKQDYSSIVQLEEEIRSKNRIQQQNQRTRNVVDFVEWQQVEKEEAEKILPIIKESIHFCRDALEREVKQVQLMQWDWMHQSAKGIQFF